MGGFASSSAFPTLNPGDLRHWVIFLNQTITQGISGQNTTWQAATPPQGAWAKIEAVRGAEIIRSGQNVTVLYLTVSMWYRPNVRASMHLQIPSGAELVINSIENVLEMNHILILNCQAIGGEADTSGSGNGSGTNGTGSAGCGNSTLN